MKKNGKKIFLLLLILTLVGIVGYGVYSYYYASGSVTHTGTIEVDGFDVSLYNGSGLSDENSAPVFISGNHETELICEYDSGETFICDGYAEVHNYGTKDVEVEISNLNAEISGIDSANVVNVSTDWEFDSTTISAGTYNIFSITVEVEVPGYEEPSDDAVQLTSPIEGGELTVTVSYDITATEVHD